MRIDIQEGFPSVEVIIKCPEVTEEIHRMASLLQDSRQKLNGIKDGLNYLINRHDVFYFESVDKRCFIYTANEVYETGFKLYEIEEQLTESGFFRNSKSQVLNIAKIKSLCPDFAGRIEASMENGEILIVSRQYSKLLRERLKLK